MSRLPLCLSIILVTLPFTNSVTVPVGFPLKIYELVAAVGILSLLGNGVQLGRLATIPVYWIAFAGASLFASAFGLNLIYEHGTHMLEWAHGRYQPLVNTIYHYCYLLLDIGILMLVVQCLHRGWLTARAFVKYWLTGSLLAVVYAVALNVVLLLGLSPVLLLRWDKIQYMQMAGFNIARTGPFLEGNYFGLYLVLSLTLALWAAQRFPDRYFRLVLPVLLLGVLISASPTAIVCTLVLLMLALVFGGVSPWLRLAGAVGGVLIIAVMIGTGLMQTLIVDKFSLIFFGGVTDTHNVSLVQRVNESYHAWQMFLDYPLGVGMGNFGYLFGNYPDLFLWLQTDFVNTKRIVNNVYLEVLCEHGILLGILFLYLVLLKIYRLLIVRQWLLSVGMVLLAVYFLAFPTFRLALIWVFWGFVVWLGRTHGELMAEIPEPTPAGPEPDGPRRELPLPPKGSDDAR